MARSDIYVHSEIGEGRERYIYIFIYIYIYNDTEGIYINGERMGYREWGGRGKRKIARERNIERSM